MAPENNGTMTGDQLPFNNTQVMSTRQSHDNREEALNHKNHHHTCGQTQFNNKVSTSEGSILEDPQLPISPTNIRLGPPNKENKKNVQFQTPENEHQAAMQDKNLKVMETLVNHSTNAFVLDDIPVFDGLKGSIDFKN